MIIMLKNGTTPKGVEKVKKTILEGGFTKATRADYPDNIAFFCVGQLSEESKAAMKLRLENFPYVETVIIGFLSLNPEKPCRSGSGDLVGTRLHTARDTHCYQFLENERVQKTKEILHSNMPVTCGETRSVRNGNGTMLLVRINIYDPSTKEKAWVKFSDLSDNR